MRSTPRERESETDRRYALGVDDSLAKARRASLLSVALNVALALVKLATGVAGNSYALVADAVESLGDVLSGAIVWGGMVIASRPADENHPYGHGKADPLAGLVVALLLVVAAVWIASEAIHHIRLPHASPASYTLIVLIAVILIKEGMYRFLLQTGERIGSTALSADAWHHRGDAVTSAAAAVGITVALVGGAGYESADDWAALLACLLIAGNGLRFTRLAVLELMDTTPQADLADGFRAAALEVAGAQAVEKVLVRKMGPRLYIDLHLEVSPSLTVLEAHDIAHAVKNRIRDEWAQVADVLVHVEPHVPRA